MRIFFSLWLCFAAATVRADHIYVSVEDNGQPLVYVLSSESEWPNNYLSAISGPSEEVGAEPFGLAFSPAGNLYVADGADSQIDEYSPTGTLLGQIYMTGISDPVGLAFDSTGNLYVSYFTKDTIEKYSPTGVDLGVFTTTNLNLPAGLAFDGSGNLYVANFEGNSIEKFSPTGVDLGHITSANLDLPNAVAFDRSGNLYVANNGSNTIEKFSPSGVDLGVFATTELENPADLAFDSSGNLFVTTAAQDFDSIEEFSPTGTLEEFEDLGSVPYFMALTNDAGTPLSLPPVPEPTGAALLTVGAMLLALRRPVGKRRWNVSSTTLI